MSNYRIPKMIEAIQQSFCFAFLKSALQERACPVDQKKKKKSLNYSGGQAQEKMTLPKEYLSIIKIMLYSIKYSGKVEKALGLLGSLKEKLPASGRKKR